MTPEQQDVWDFHHDVCGDDLPDEPTNAPAHITALRENLIREEANEIFEELKMLSAGFYKDDPDRGLANLAKELCDLQYVLLGTAVQFGIDLEPIWNAVHSSNMEKAGGSINEHGKRMKPEGWQPPNIIRLIRLQNPEPT
jgi:predicted HAD superfamily Cof-like phosphohydrolase